MSFVRVFAAASLAALAAAGPAVAQAPAAPFAPRFATAQSRLAADLLQRVARPGAGVAVSPASVAGVAAALDLGASDRLRDGLHRTLGFRDGQASGDMAALRRGAGDMAAAEGGPLRFASGVFFDAGVALYPGVPLAFEQARFDMRQLSFADPQSADVVNAWVKERTAGLIPDLVDKLPGGTNLVALNALHFKDRWKTPFDPAATKPAPFRRVGAAAVQVPMMRLAEGSWRFRRDARFIAVELPYADERYRMVIMTNRADRPVAARAFRGAASWFAGEGFQPGPGEVQMPRFSVSAREDLTPALDALGLRRARLSTGALAGFSADPVRITRVLQRVELKLDEAGTEAAAATAVIAERSLGSGFVRMIVDRPFVYALRDASTGAILVTGYVADPSGAAKP